MHAGDQLLTESLVEFSLILNCFYTCPEQFHNWYYHTITTIALVHHVVHGTEDWNRPQSTTSRMLVALTIPLSAPPLLFALPLFPPVHVGGLSKATTWRATQAQRTGQLLPDNRTANEYHEAAMIDRYR